MNSGLECGGEAPAGAVPSPHVPVVERVIAAMHQGEDGALRLSTMAEMANLSPYHFARTFRTVTGVPPGESSLRPRVWRGPSACSWARSGSSR